MRSFAQIVAVTGYTLRSIPGRVGSSLVIVVGIAGAVAVLISVMAMSTSFRRTLLGDAREDRIVVLANGAIDESSSSLARSQVDAIVQAPGIRRDIDGKTLASAEVLFVAPVSRRRTGTDAYLTLRGVGTRFLEMHPELQVTAGRAFEPGVQELIIGEAARRQFTGLDLGGRIRLHDGDWTIVGIFEGGDNARESEVIADVTTVMASYKIDAFNSVTAMLDSKAAVSYVKDAMRANPHLDVNVFTEPEHLAMASRAFQRILAVVAYVVGGIMAIGAVFAALNTMYSAVVVRAQEIATLRAFGFRPIAILTSIVVEAVLLALVGALIGSAVAYLLLDGVSISTLGGSRWDSQLVYRLAVSVEIILGATIAATAIGLLGGFFPAWQAARASVSDALRA